MIERYLIRNELAMKRYRKFKRNKTAVLSVVFLVTLAFFSFTADFWANNKPIVLKYQDQLYFPVVFTYHPTQFGNEDIQVMDYKGLKLSDQDWAFMATSSLGSIREQ